MADDLASFIESQKRKSRNIACTRKWGEITLHVIILAQLLSRFGGGKIFSFFLLVGPSKIASV